IWIGRSAVTTPIPRDRRPRTTSPSMASSSGTDEGGSLRFRGRGKDFFDRSIFGRDVAVNLVPVGVVVGQGRVNLRQRKGLDFGGDLLGSQTQVVPAGNAPNRDAGTGDARPALADLWRSLNQGADIDNGGHFLRSILLGVGPFSDSVEARTTGPASSIASTSIGRAPPRSGSEPTSHMAAVSRL